MNCGLLPEQAADFLSVNHNRLAGCRATIGLDGFVDEIVHVVQQRESPDQYTPFTTMSAFAAHIQKGASISTNAELVVRRVKLGGNGPIMANALARFGAAVSYIGNVGYPRIHAAFAELAMQATVYSVAEPGHTVALEFDDGKLMLGKIEPLRDVNWETIGERVGGEKLVELMAESCLVGFQNWTMLPFMSDIWRHMLEEVCPRMLTGVRRTLFLDLADPERRRVDDLRGALRLIRQFQRYFDTYLGLNEKEGMQVAHALGYNGPTSGEEAVKGVAKFIFQQLNISGVVLHPRQYALVVSDADDEMPLVRGPFTTKPVISTGGGDHFNAGFCAGKMLGATNAVSLQIGAATAGYYVQRAKSPTVAELVAFLKSLV